MAETEVELELILGVEVSELWLKVGLNRLQYSVDITRDRVILQVFDCFFLDV